jgi:hypothetical protein
MIEIRLKNGKKDVVWVVFFYLEKKNKIQYKHHGYIFAKSERTKLDYLHVLFNVV